MKRKLLTFIVPLVILAFSACSNDNGRNHEGNKDNDNRGNHATDPAEPSDKEYPGSKVYDSLHSSDTVNHH
ncbi:MAG: hypothetical protein JWO32_2308 [Bacteroidetes bacterium]|nr:hypothetical protein [Bacteroidota bacterium]